MRIPSGSIDRYIFFVAVDSVDNKTRELNLTNFTVYRSRDGDTPVAYTTPTVVELSSSNMPGVYALLIDEDTTIDAAHETEEYAVHITQADMAPVTRTVELYRPTLDEIVEVQGSITTKQALQAFIAALAGVTARGGEILKTPNGSATRITCTVNASNNERESVTLNFS
jgi:hypothetical protein